MWPTMRIVIPALLALTAGGAHAQGLERQWAACDDLTGEGTPASVIAGCTALIQSGQLTPQSLSSAHRSRGSAYRASGDLARALPDYGEAIRLNPRDADLLYVRANTYAMQRDYVRAIADYDEAIKIDPDNPQLFNNRGGAYHNQMNYPRALADFDRALALDSEYPAALTNRCAARVALRQDLDKAQADCTLSLRLRPNHLPTLDTRGLAALLRKDYPAALADYEAALRLNGQEYGALYGRGLAQIGLGRTEAGRADIARANTGDPTVAAFYETSGLKP